MKKLLITTALTASLALGGLAYAHGDMPGGPGGPGGPGHDGPPPPPFENILPKDKAEQFHEAMKQAEEKNLVLIEQKHELREQLHAILVAPKFDKDAFLAKSDEMSKFDETLHEKLHANMREAFATGLSQLSQEERQAVSVEFDKMHEEHGEGHWGHHGHGMWDHGDHEHHWDHMHGDEHAANAGPDAHKADKAAKPSSTDQ